MKLKGEVGMAVLKSTQNTKFNKICRDNISRPLYIPMLACLNINIVYF